MKPLAQVLKGHLVGLGHVGCTGLAVAGLKLAGASFNPQGLGFRV